MTSYKILRLEAENVKRLRAVSITPEGNLVVIGGENEQGKSSCLDSIMYCLAGGKSLPAEPVRQGEEKAQVVLDLGEFLVKRTFTAKGGTSLTVNSREGYKFPTPQAMLDRLLGKLSFDPLEFTRMKPKEQLACLKSLLGLDFSQLDYQRDCRYGERTEVNREIKQLEGEIAGYGDVNQAPDWEVSIAELLEKQREAQRTSNKLISCESAMDQAMFKVEKLKEQLHLAEVEFEQAKHAFEIASEHYIDPTQYAEKIKGAESVNRQARAKQMCKAQQTNLEAKKAESQRLTEAIQELEMEKARRLGQVTFPVPGLGLGDNGVVLHGVPFEQASSAAQLVASVGIGLALNPALKVLLIRDGSLLDAAHLALIGKLAEEADAQVWMERVGDGEECSVVIEDGQIKERT